MDSLTGSGSFSRQKLTIHVRLNAELSLLRISKTCVISSVGGRNGLHPGNEFPEASRRRSLFGYFLENIQYRKLFISGCISFAYLRYTSVKLIICNW